jgi:hypothetical protein
MRHKMGILKPFKLKQVAGMMNSIRLVKLKKGLVTPGRKITQ